LAGFASPPLAGFEVATEGACSLAAPAPETKIEELFSATRRSLPRPAPKNWRFSIAGTNESFVLTVSLGRKITQAVFFPLVESQIDNAAPQKLQAADSGFRLTLRKSDQLLKPIEHLKGVLVLSGDQAYLIDVPVGKLGAAVTGIQTNRELTCISGGHGVE
jgi:DsbC/DsbD-like thiol-disulfide interchange protein